jgi:kynurenine formamidase
MGRTCIDLSHAVEEGMTTYPGLPGPAFEDFLTREESRARLHPETEFQFGTIRMVGNTGTYLDSPFHRFEGGADLAELPLSSLADLPGLVVRPDRTSGRGVDAEAFRGCQVEGKAVLVETGWSRHWGTPRYGEGNPFLTRNAAALLRDEGAVLVGIDSVNIDDMEDPLRPAHTLLLGAGIPVVEHLTGLESLPAQGFRFFAVPVKVRRFGTFPVRAFALMES